MLREVIRAKLQERAEPWVQRAYEHLRARHRHLTDPLAGVQLLQLNNMLPDKRRETYAQAWSLVEDYIDELDREYEDQEAKRPWWDKLFGESRLVEMAAKTMTNIPEGWKVQVVPYSAISVEFSLRTDKGSTKAMVRTLYREKCNLWEVANSSASEGWGPFMYDIAMEHASGYNIQGVSNYGADGLMSDRYGPSEEADAVWRYYYENRPDVKKQYMSEFPWANCDQPFAHGVPVEEDHHVSFYNKSPEILPRLEAAGKLVVYE